MSSIATVTGSPAGTSSATTSLAAARPRSSALHRARAKNQCARSCGHSRDRAAPASMPHTVRFPAWDKNPQARAVKVRNDGAVNNGPNTASRLASEAGSGSITSGSIGTIPFRRQFPGTRGPQARENSAPPLARRQPGLCLGPARRTPGLAAGSWPQISQAHPAYSWS